MSSLHHPSDYLHTRYQDKAGFKNDEVSVDPVQYQVALFGLGRAGIIHLNNLMSTPRFQLRYIVDSSHTRLQRVRTNYCLDDSVILLTDSQAGTVFTDKSIKAVVIATPSQLHETYVVPALSAGKHVLCEKPVALDLDAIKKCYQLAERHNRTLLCAFNRRFDPAYQAVEQEVLSGGVGKIHSINSVARDCPKPTLQYIATSGGIFHDCIVHDVDLICNFVLKELPEKVFAATHAFDPEIAKLKDFDTVNCTLKFPSGALGHIDISREALYGYDQRLEVFGDKGMVQSANQRPNAVLKSTKTSSSVHPIMYSFPSRYHEGYIRELEHFLAVIDGTTENTVTAQHVFNCLKIIEALEESVKTEGFVKVQY